MRSGTSPVMACLPRAGGDGGLFLAALRASAKRRAWRNPVRETDRPHFAYSINSVELVYSKSAVKIGNSLRSIEPAPDPRRARWRQALADWRTLLGGFPLQRIGRLEVAQAEK